VEKIGDKELVYRGSFLLPHGDSASFSANVEGWQIDVTVDFQDTDGEQAVRIVPTDPGATIILVNWNSSIGTATVAPATLGTHSSGKKLYFMVSNYRIGKTNKLDLQLLLEANR
jgi:hypothetical protein